MLEPQRTVPDGVSPTHLDRRGRATDRRHGGWLPGQPDRRQGPTERRQRVQSLSQAGRRRGLPDRRVHARIPCAGLPPLTVGQDVLTVVSHELRTPLTTIQGYAQLLARRLRERGAADDLLGPANAIGAQARRLGTLVDELLDLTELAHPDPRLQAYRLDLAVVVREAVASAQAQARKHPIVCDTEETLPVRGDAERLRQLVGELLRNAAKFSSDGGSITVRAWATDQHVLLVVADQGVGIAPPHLHRIFEPFFQLTPEECPQAGGLGLGLTLCTAIVHGHGGQLGADSTPGQGSRFWVQLPRASPADR
jgi:signal transduction histidine kinase